LGWFSKAHEFSHPVTREKNLIEFRLGLVGRGGAGGVQSREADSRPINWEWLQISK
jgi:hypothetical protein